MLKLLPKLLDILPFLKDYQLIISVINALPYLLANFFILWTTWEIYGNSLIISRSVFSVLNELYKG